MTKEPSRPFSQTSKALLQDPEYAAIYLEECLASGDMDLFKLALRNVADARLGGMTALSKKARLDRESLYKALSKNGNPKLESLTRILNATGLHLPVVVA